MISASACVETSIVAVCVPLRKSIGFAEGQARGNLADLAVAGPICVFPYCAGWHSHDILALFLLIFILILILSS